ncbi:MAG: hypothetical protein ACLTXI_00125 [Collinsella sp.]
MLAGVDGLKLVTSAQGGSQVFIGSCTADGLRGTSCSFKLIRGDIAHLRRQEDFFRRVLDVQADAGGTSRRPRTVWRACSFTSSSPFPVTIPSLPW